MTVTTDENADLTAADIAWDLEPLLGDAGSPERLLDQADAITDALQRVQGTRGFARRRRARRVADDGGEDGRADQQGGPLHVDCDSARTPAILSGARRCKRCGSARRRSRRESLFFDLEWAVVDDDHVRAVLADERLAFAEHHLETLRRTRPHLLTEPEETMLSEKSVIGVDAWVRLFEEQTSAIDVGAAETTLGGTVPLMQALSFLQHPDREVRATSATAITAGLEPGLRTRAFIFNTLLLDKAWTTGCVPTRAGCPAGNLANEAVGRVGRRRWSERSSPATTSRSAGTR